MSANPQNTGLELVHEAPRPELGARRRNLLPIGDARRGDALQSLLAFATLRQQVLDRQEADRDSNSTKPGRGLDLFALDEVLQLVAQRALTITGADGIAIALAENDAIICRASSGTVAPDPGARVDPNSGFSGACLVSGQVIRCDDSENDARVDAVACRRLGARSMLAVPLSAKQTVIGLMEAFSSEPCGFNDCDVRSLDLLAELILAAIRPDEEDRLAEISRKVVAKPAIETGGSGIPAEAFPPDGSDGYEKEKGEPGEPGVIVPAPDVLGPNLAGYATAEASRPGLGLVVGVLCLAIALGGALWWIIHRNFQFSARQEARIVGAQPAGSDASPLGVAGGGSSELGEDEMASAESHTKPSEMTAVTGIRHWSASDSSTVVIDLENQVQYEAHRLSSPERIYFDLHDTKLAAGVTGKPIDVQDAFLQRIRVAQSTNGITRVVLETKGSPDFSVSLQQDPYRLVVEVQKPGSKPRDRARIDLFAPMAPAIPTPANAGSLPAQSPTALAAGANSNAAGASSGLRIALDAGHGGWDLGTAGKTGLLEKDLVFDIVARLGQLIENRMGATVIYTRHSDDYVALEKRAEIANLAHADLFLSVHANHSGSASARGAETYYTNTYSSVKARDLRDGDPSLKNINWTKVDIREKAHESRRFAVSVQHALHGSLAAGNPGLPNRGVKQAEYVVLTGTFMPAVLAEVSFVSSPTDEGNLKSAAYRQQIAEALYQGIARYAKDSSRMSLASNGGKPALR
jgi:N-acetylmuramoyl-L-alanine amidase